MNNKLNKARIVGVIKFYKSKVMFMVKAAMKPIPAMIILMFIGSLIFGVLGAFGGF